MELNRLEFYSMNNRARKFLMEHVEFPKFRKLLRENHVDLHNKILLDVAAGSGFSSRLLIQTFHPKHLVGFDLMPSQVELYRKENPMVPLFLGSVLQLPLRSEIFDGIFGFGFLHHVTDWPRAIQELSRVLKPGGYLVLEEPNAAASRFFRQYVGFQIPPHGEFSFQELHATMAQSGLHLLGSERVLLECFRCFLFRKAGL